MVNYDSTPYAKAYIKEDYANYVQKCKDSSRGYALKLTHDDGRYAWIGLAFHDRPSAFQFHCTISEHLKRKNQKVTPFKVDPNLNFALNKGQKIKLNITSENKGNKTPKKDAFGGIKNLKLNIGSKKKKSQNNLDDNNNENKDVDFLNF